jgi:nucleotide-binding universal stress UspA family protein
MRGTIVCGVTDSSEAREAAQLAAALAARLGLRLVLAHVADRASPREGHDAGKPGDVSILRALQRRARELCDEVETRVVLGGRVDALAQVAADEGADLIVLGSRPRGARHRQLRCTLARDLEAAQAVPVLIAPPATRDRSGRRLTLAGAAPTR